MLEIESLDVGYGDFQALFGIDLHVAEAETVSIIGANGAGKSTLLKAIVGTGPPMRGDIRSTASRSRRVRRTAASPRASHSCRRAGASSRRSRSRRTSSIGGDSAKRRARGTRRRCSTRSRCSNRLLKRNGEGSPEASSQTLAIARALMANPRLLLLDEVSLGLAPIVVRQVYEAIPVIKSQGTTVLIVEQDVNQALAVADRFYCLLEGRSRSTGTPGRGRPRSRSPTAYFGMSTVHGKQH